jgi:hypothetical protein
MSRKRDPVEAMLKYFEEAELPLARQGLVLAQLVIRRRSPKAAAPARTRSKSKPAVAPPPGVRPDPVN